MKKLGDTYIAMINKLKEKILFKILLQEKNLRLLKKLLEKIEAYIFHFSRFYSIENFLQDKIFVQCSVRTPQIKNIVL